MLSCQNISIVDKTSSTSSHLTCIGRQNISDPRIEIGLHQCCFRKRPHKGRYLIQSREKSSSGHYKTDIQNKFDTMRFQDRVAYHTSCATFLSAARQINWQNKLRGAVEWAYSLFCGCICKRCQGWRLSTQALN